VGVAAALLGSAIAGALGVAVHAGIDWIELIIQVLLAAVGVTLAAGMWSRRAPGPGPARRSIGSRHDGPARTVGRSTDRGGPMGTDDKIANKTEELTGQAKEAVGDATDDRDLQAEGQADQTKGNLKQAGEKIKDAFKG
jgi:uncharacterized protein YjbJ (UPF0337 family)